MHEPFIILMPRTNLSLKRIISTQIAFLQRTQIEEHDLTSQISPDFV